MQPTLKELFTELLTNYTDNTRLVDELWSEVEKNYSYKKRFYHTLSHLEHVFEQLFAVKEQLQDWETMLFSLYYHDSIYNAIASDNEEESAKLAEKRMKQLSVPKQQITLCKEQILATKSHAYSTNADTNYFTDADLSVLGKTCAVYTSYYENVRKEYFIYPDMIYKPGRKKVLQHFLNMKRIFKTDYFYERFENQARENLYAELESL